MDILMSIFYIIPVSYDGRNSMNILSAKFIECISRGLTTYVTNRRNTFSDENQFCVIYLSLLTSQRHHIRYVKVALVC